MRQIPDWLEPMGATLTHERFAGGEWLFERKLDGIRLLAFKDGPEVRLLSRNRLPQGYPSVARAIANLPVRDLVLDGEAAWDPGRRVAYHVFDILWIEGRLLTSMPLEERRGAPGPPPPPAPPGRGGRGHPPPPPG